MAVELADYQLDAIERLKNGSILCGGMGTGKSRTSLAYYFLKECKGDLKINGKGSFHPMREPRNLYIITTAKKRDNGDWLKECSPFSISNVTIDSWNNIKKYKEVYGAFFIFDEQRVVGKGVWVKTFLNIARKNRWILLSATPGDKWVDYIPVFVANGFYKNKTEFNIRHIIFKPYSHYPQIQGYIDEGLLARHRDDILVMMKRDNGHQVHNMRIQVDYDKLLYKRVMKDRWNPYEDCPIENPSKLLYLLRKVVNSDNSRIAAVTSLVAEHDRCIIFYNYEFEVEILKKICNNLDVPYAEWNGQNHNDLPEGNRWCYLVQYLAGCEGWNCTTTDTIIFYSQTYSYRQMEQAKGRIDRMNTPYNELYYYHVVSYAPIDTAIRRALNNKMNFNERMFLKNG